MSSAMSSLLRKSLRSSLLPSLASKQYQSLSFSSSISSSSSSSPLLRRIPQNPAKPSPPFLSSFRFASSGKKAGADEKLKRVLDSEIKCAEESDDLDQGLPDVSPFEIVDNPGEQTISLKREFMGESIQVEVHMSGLTGEEDEENDDADSGDDNEDNSSQPNVSLVVTVAKGEGPILEFCCTAYPDKFTIDSMLMKGQQVSDDQIAYEGPEFSDLDDNLQKAFCKYLEARGIKSSLTNSLQEYMVKKDNREYSRWLKNMKDFIEA